MSLLLSVSLWVVLVCLKFTESTGGHQKSCVGPDYPGTYPDIISKDLCADFQFQSQVQPSTVQVTVFWDGQPIGSQTITEGDSSSDKTICKGESMGCALCQGYNRIEISNEYAVLCPKLMVNCQHFLPSGQWDMPCVNLGDDHLDDVPIVVTGANQFAMNLLSTNALEKDMDGFVSPFNLMNALSMPFMGALGNTRQQIMDTLHIDKPNIHVYDAIATLTQTLTQEDKYVDENIQNRLWLASTWMNEIHPTFLEHFKRFGTVASSDFASGPELETFIVNHWIYEQTRGTIDNGLNSKNFTEATVAVFTSLIYLQSNWINRFGETQTQTFVDSDDNQEHAVSMMFLKDVELPVYRDHKVEVIELPFAGETMKLSMIVIRPQSMDEMTTIELEKNLNMQELKSWLDHLQTTRVESLGFPEFTMYNTQDMTEILKSLGVTDLFDPKEANLTNLTTKGYAVYEDAINRKDYFKVTRTGIVTASLCTDGIGHDPINQGPIDHADRPFVFLVMDRSLDLILFAGRITNPKGWTMEGGGNHTPPVGRTAAGVVVFLVIVLFISCYCVGGYIYNSQTQGRSGFDALPHSAGMRNSYHVISEKLSVIKERVSESFRGRGDSRDFDHVAAVLESEYASEEVHGAYRAPHGNNNSQITYGADEL